MDKKIIINSMEDPPWNLTNVHLPGYDDFKMDSNFACMLFSLISGLVWVTYITYYNSRVTAYIVTRLLTRFYATKGYLSIGSFTVCALSGKIMFRDIVYITEDYTIRVQDGWLIFRWWRSYVPKDVSEDLSHSDTRLSVMLNGFEQHVYNRCKMYSNLEKVFNLDPSIIPWDELSVQEEEAKNINDKKQEAVLGKSWRDLIPVIKLEVSSGRVVFGNRLIPTTLLVNVEEAHFVYSTKPAASKLDHFMHFVKCKAENLKVILAPSPKYTGMADDPPRYMGAGFVVFSSNNVELYYYMDEPGVVPEEPEMLQLANGDIVESAPPIWGIDIKCGKGTDFSYGPWADRQREHLFKLFFPQDYQNLKVSDPPLPGEKRQVQAFDIRLNTLYESTIDILFSKNKETNAIHINVGPGSYMEITLPWLVVHDGYTTKITGQLLHLEATTSLQFRSLLESETLEFTAHCHYPIQWNDHQEWLFNLTGCKATGWFTYAHKGFFQELINDWASKSRPDILHFVPYTWKFSVLMKEFELITISNEYNWIDCSSQNQENALIAASGDLFDFSFDLPFTEFLPDTLPLRFWIQGESIDLSLYLPEVCTSRSVLLSLNQNAKLLGRDGKVFRSKLDDNGRKWRNVCQKSLGWVDCWTMPIVALSINFIYHPMPMYGPPPQADITTPEKEEKLLSPMRMQHHKAQNVSIHWTREEGQKFDPTTLPADKVSLELEIGSSVMFLYGSWLRHFFHLKESIFGEDQIFTDMNDKLNPKSTNTDKATADLDNGSLSDVKTQVDPREYRPLEVVISITMHDLQAHLIKNCNDNDPPCPVIIIERFGLEMKKCYTDTQLQLLLSPSLLISSDKLGNRSGKDHHLNQGHLMLSALQIRGHAMFSDAERNLNQATLEYAWLLEIQLGKLSGKATAPQLFHIVTGLETLFLLMFDSENQLKPAHLPLECHHGSPPSTCPHNDPQARYRCPTADEIKYRMTRVAIDALDIYLVESGTSINFWASPLRLSHCNLHSNHLKSGITLVIPAVKLKQFICAGAQNTPGLNSNTNTTGSNRSQHRGSSSENQEMWLEIGSASLGPFILELASSLSDSDKNLHLVQHKYLKLHDDHYKRLWFLWPSDSRAIVTGKCGCVGGCAFFGRNRNGQRFFKPSKSDIQDGINIAAFIVNESGKDPGFGQSILHDCQLIFHTPPYNIGSGVVIHDHPVPQWPNIRHINKVYQDQSEGSKSSHNAPTNIPYTLDSEDIPSPLPTHPLSRRFSYSSAASRLNGVQTISREVPYSRLIDASPTPVLKMDSRPPSPHRFNTNRSILSVPENTLAVDNGACPKYSVSDSRLAVDYFNTTALQYNALITSAHNNSNTAGNADSIHSLHQSSSKHPYSRTISITSDNPSEVFFSAEEDLTLNSSLKSNDRVPLGSARCSSLKSSLNNSGIGQNESFIKNHFGSETTIIPSSPAVLNDTSVQDHTIINIETLECDIADDEKTLLAVDMSRDIIQNPLLKAKHHLLENESDGGILDSSDSRSISSTSFMSAVSSQEDLALVNLHMHINKPIVDSPLLLTTYTNHLSQTSCTNWFHTSLPAGSDVFTVPIYQHTIDDRLVFIGSRFLPKFETTAEGFTSLKMVPRTDAKEKEPSPHTAQTQSSKKYTWDQSQFDFTQNAKETFEMDCEEEMVSLRSETGTRTTVVIKLKGDIDLMVTPLALESLQKFVDSLIPTFSNLHPLTVLNHLHSSCISRVEAANILKRDKYLSQMQGGGSKRSTVERLKPNVNKDQPDLQQPNRVYEEFIASQVQGTVILPKINICVLQASIVEEVISFSALDNIRDLTCVSLLAICLEELTTKFHFSKQAREIVQTYQPPVVAPSGQKKGVLSRAAGKAFLLGLNITSEVDPESTHGEPVYIETSEKQQEETVITLHISRAHAQLRRLHNECSILKDAVITAIPSHCSKVMFKTCSKVKSTEIQNSINNDNDEMVLTNISDEKLGFIMMECGFEGISFKVVKRSNFEKENDREIRDVPSPSPVPESTIGKVSHSEVRPKNEDIESKANTSSKQDIGGCSTPITTPKQVKTPPETNINNDDTIEGTVAKVGIDKNASSCVMEVCQVWFNFAAPPLTPITRKIDYTRHDWNLLSTASPAINAWMNPSNRFAMRLVHMLRTRYRRCTAVVTCLMAEALDVQSLHIPLKSRYRHTTPLAKTLQEDPSCQLCNILQKYLLQTDSPIDANLKDPFLPNLSILRQGVIVLSRQWKNILYTPLLLEHNFKSRHHNLKPLNVTFAVSDAEEDGEVSGEEGGEGITDECAMLLTSERHSHVSTLQRVLKSHTSKCGTKGNYSNESHYYDPFSPTGMTDHPNDSVVISSHASSCDQPKNVKSLLPTQMPASSRASVMFPILDDTVQHTYKNIVDVPLGDNNYQPPMESENTTGSVEDIHFSPQKSDRNEDLYTWMAKQDFINQEPRVSSRLVKAKRLRRNWNLRKGPLRVCESKNVPTTSDIQSSADFAESDSLRFNIFPKYDSLRLLDAHLIFEPLLSSLGVMPQQMVNPNSGNNGMAALDSWGSNLSLVGSLETMRIDIVVSEYGKLPENGKKTKPFKKKLKSETPWLDLLPEVPAFLCDRVSIECDVRRSADMTVVDDIRRQRRNMLYLSRGQLKKHSNTSFNICVSVRYISQQVNMPLLRLLNQITNMYQNVKDTQTELREQQPHQYVTRTTAKPPTSQSDHSEVPIPTPPPIKRFLPRSASELKPIVSPSPSIRSKHQTLAQKLRSTGKSVKGYMNLNETPIVSECLTPSLSEFERITPMKPIDEVDSNIVSMTPRCWKTVYHLLELYARMPETKTVTQRISFGVDVSEGYKGTRKYDILPETKSCDDIVKDGSTSTPVPPVSQLNPRVTKEERTRLMVFVVVRIHRTRLLATLSGLKLEAEITNLHTSSTFRKKTRPPSLECSLTGHIGRTMIVLLEGVAPNQQTVVKVTVGKSQTLYSSMSRRAKDQNSGLLTIGVINIDIPQHPVALHGMMTRGSKQLSSTLQELRVARTSSRMGRVPTIDESDAQGSVGPSSMAAQQSPMVQRVHKEEVNKVPESNVLLQPLVMHFTAVIQCLTVTAALLPSLRAQYKMDQVTSTGYTGNKAKFIIDLPQHTLSFSTKIPVTETNLPSEASLELPKVHVSAEYILDGGLKSGENQFSGTDGAVLRQGNYLSAVADIGVFEQSLTTDLLNHLVFVQKVFMKEVNEVVQKVYGGEKPVPIWLEDNDTDRSAPVKRILFSLTIKMRRIELTATTPTNCAVRLETGSADFQLSNRVQNVSGSSYQTFEQVKIFVKAHIDVNLSLGQVIRNPLFEEADPEFQSFAFFKTRIELRNAFQGEMVGEGEDKEVILITLRRPLIYIQPMAVDKAILVWLNYKNAYEYWNEQRASLNKEVLTATQPSTDKLPTDKIPVSPNLGTIFLQLTVEDMGICVPLNPLPQTTWGLNRSIFMDFESCSAVVVTLESTSISACSSGSLVSKGRFIGLCLRFADDFDSSLDDWKPDITNELVSTAMNLCIVSEGTYEVCSRTTSQKLESVTENAKWFLNVKWQMEGVDMHLDVNIGKQLSALGHTLTALTGVQDTDDPLSDSDPISQDSDIIRHKSNMEGDILASLAIDPTMNAKTRSKIIEKEMYEQAKAINDLRSLGASQGTIEHEVKRLRELEAMVFKGFRRDMIQKLRRQSVKGKSSLKGKFGLSNKSSTYRSKSFIVSPTQEVAEFKETQSPDEVTSLSSVENSPQAGGPQRSTSFRVTNPGHVTFSNTKEIFRQSSLPSASSEQSLATEGDDSWPNTDYSRPMDSRDDFLVNPLFLSGANQKPQEPNIDFELDVKVFINSGKCVLHTKDSVKEDEIKLMSRMKKERSCSGGVFEYAPGSPNLPRRSYKDKLGANSTSSSRLRHHQTVTNTLSQLSELTIFHIPGLDFKVHYESKMVSDEGQSLMYSIDSSGVISRKTSTKKASLYCWATLQSIPEETIISPHILEFLEQTLAPIPAQQFAETVTFDTMFATDNDDDLFAPYLTSGQYAYTSFPVDVIVYLHVQTSTFRFSCLPVSRVECMLKLPSLDIVFSSKRTDSSTELEDYYEDSNSLPVAVGGLSITGAMADFSMYIFHPYGGKKSTANLKEPHAHAWSPLADGERKDSLSVNVEFVKFHLSRSRKLNFESVPGPKTTSDQSHATIRFSTIVDIGSASFKYDMRRLTEILAFPRAWYRRSIVRRLFLGDLTRTVPNSVYSDHSNNVEHEDSYGHFVTDTKVKPSRDKLHLNIKGDKQLPLEKKKNNSSHDSSPDQKSSSVGSAAWETLVIFAVNFKRLNVHMNMGNVMGNVTWLSKQFHSEGRLSIGSTGHKNMHIGLGLGGSGLDAKGGIVGGTIELNKINTYVLIREDPGSEPRHTVGLKLSALELRLDYMGTAVLMSRVSSLEVLLKDEWKVLNKAMSVDNGVHDSSKRPGIVFMHGDLGWDQLQLMISKSTSSDIMKMFCKLEEFFSQQFKSSKRVFSSLQDPRDSISNEKSSKKKTVRRRLLTSISSPDNLSPDECKHHHRHWQRALEAVSGLRLSTLKYPLPHWGTVLGGKMDLHGVNISLACFHGINFKSKSWALFSLKEPCISFATEAHEIFKFGDSGPLCRDDLDINIVQNLTFSLGMEGTVRPQHSMATVCKFSRNVLFPPQFKTIQEWFNYAFALSDIDEVDRFPSLEREKPDAAESAPRSRTPKPHENLTHTREVIFALPTLQLNLKTDHSQPVKLPSPCGIKPTIECSFITEFEDHIFVTVDAEAFFFLHDLITSYILEKDKVSSMANRPQSPDSSNTKNTSQSTTELPQSFTNDWRDYNCTTWHLEPTVRLLSWGGKSIEPYGVDYILQKLGFSHARTTIPKWMQRGFMDPLDKVLSVLMLRMIAIAREEDVRRGDDPA